MSQPIEPTSSKEGRTDDIVNTAETPKLTAAPVQQARSPPFRFLSLPPKLRNEIYKLLLVSAYPIYATLPSCASASPSGPFKLSSADENWLWQTSTTLLLISQQIHHEAERILYSHNEFILDAISPFILKPFLGSLGSARASLLSHLRIDFLFVRYMVAERMRKYDPGSLRLVKHGSTGPREVTIEPPFSNPDLPLVGFSSDDECCMLYGFFDRLNTELEVIPSLKKVNIMNRPLIEVPWIREVIIHELGWVIV
ncbi:hypothetical protein F4859DRAFT_267286 [Xylaria cf. heliscus]|nr:hypothetical protein F4859DRAFT_267286 [Xylaria cf. heliscus]